jgi:hypothetical protein
MSERRQGFTLTQNMGWGSPSTPHFLHKGLPVSPIMWRCLLRVLWPVRRRVTALDCTVLRDNNIVLVAVRGPEINSRACLLSAIISRAVYLTSPEFFSLCSASRSPKAGSGPIKWWTEPSFASSSAISFPRIPECPGTKRVPQNNRWRYRSTPVVTIVATATSPLQPVIISELLDYQSIYSYLFIRIHVWHVSSGIKMNVKFMSPFLHFIVSTILWQNRLKFVHRSAIE